MVVSGSSSAAVVVAVIAASCYIRGTWNTDSLM
jgi:hypothetical protein